MPKDALRVNTAILLYALGDRLVRPEITGEEVALRCPFHDDHQPSASFNRRTGLWQCFGCGMRGDTLDLWAELQAARSPEFAAKWQEHRWQMRQDEEIIGEYHAWIAEAELAYEHGEHATCTVRWETRRRPPLPLPTPEEIEKWVRRLQESDTYLALLGRKGLRAEDARRFRLGLDEHGMITIPISVHGTLVNVKRYRFFPPPGAPKMLSWPGSKATLWSPEDALYSHPHAEVVVCAGEWDAMLARKAGYVTVTGTAGEGSWREEWSEQLAGRPVVVVVYDNDAAGRRGSERVVASLRRHGLSPRAVFPPEEGEDLSDYVLRGGDLAELLGFVPPNTEGRPSLPAPPLPSPSAPSSSAATVEEAAGLDSVLQALQEARSLAEYQAALDEVLWRAYILDRKGELDLQLSLSQIHELSPRRFRMPKAALRDRVARVARERRPAYAVAVPEEPPETVEDCITQQWIPRRRLFRYGVLVPLSDPLEGGEVRFGFAWVQAHEDPAKRIAFPSAAELKQQQNIQVFVDAGNKKPKLYWTVDRSLSYSLPSFLFCPKEDWERVRSRAWAADLLGELREMIGSFVYLPDLQVAVDIVALWVMATYMFQVFPSFPYLYFSGPKNSGKTTLAILLSRLAWRAVNFVDPTRASLWRIGYEGNTVLIDEVTLADVQSGGDLRKLLQTGYKKEAGGSPRLSWRPDMQRYELEEFEVYSPKALFGMQHLDSSIVSRSIYLRTTTAPSHADLRPYLSDHPELQLKQQVLRNRLHWWGLLFAEEVAESYERLVQDGVAGRNNRDVEVWSPILAVGTVCGMQPSQLLDNLLLTRTHAEAADLSPDAQFLRGLWATLAVEEQVPVPTDSRGRPLPPGMWYALDKVCVHLFEEGFHVTPGFRPANYTVAEIRQMLRMLDLPSPTRAEPEGNYVLNIDPRRVEELARRLHVELDPPVQELFAKLGVAYPEDIRDTT